MTEHNARLTAAVRRLLVDDRFRESFRRDPYQATRRYRLSRREVEALKDGGAVRLEAFGADLDGLLREDKPKTTRPRGGRRNPYDLLTGRRPSPD